MNQLLKCSLSAEGSGGRNREPPMATVRSTEKGLRPEPEVSRRGGHTGRGGRKSVLGFYSPGSKIK